MSSFPTYYLRCGPLKKRKHPQTVYGTLNAPFGYRIRERSDCKILPLPVSYEHFELEKQREYEQLLKTMEFETHTNWRIRRKKLWQYVQQGMTAFQDSVNERREKLRELLLREETGLIREVVDQAQHGDDSRMEDMRQRSQQLQKHMEEQRLELVAAKRMQQYLANYPEVRTKLAKRSVYDAKMTNLVQMADNEAKKQTEKELDKLWHELMLKEFEMKKEREIEEARNRAVLKRKNLSTLDNQIAGKLALEEQKKRVQEEDREYMEQALEELRQEELRRLEKLHQARVELKKELQEQVLNANRRLAEQARQEAEMDRLRLTLVEEELAKERSKIQDTSAALRRELVTYLQYLEDLRKEEIQRQIETERIERQWAETAKAKRDLAAKKFKEARKNDLQEMIRVLNEQLKLKGEKEKEELEEKRLEKESLEKQIEMEAKLAALAKQETKDKMLRYKKDLEEQRKQTDEARLREKTEMAEFLRREELKQQEEYEKLTEELLDASENIIPHPFKVLLKQCAARYAAEKEGYCYCPPPLTEE